MNIGTQLRLRPFVSSDGMIRMEIHPERSTGELDSNGIPQTDTAQVTSNVLIPDGATIVIGGLFDNQLDDNWEGLPLLSRLPWVGILFRHTMTATTKTELIVILTPHIWRPECPQGLNYLGPPRSLGLERRVMQAPLGTGKDPPSLYEIRRRRAQWSFRSPRPPSGSRASDRRIAVPSAGSCSATAAGRCIGAARLSSPACRAPSATFPRPQESDLTSRRRDLLVYYRVPVVLLRVARLAAGNRRPQAHPGRVFSHPCAAKGTQQGRQVTCVALTLEPARGSPWSNWPWSS